MGAEADRYRPGSRAGGRELIDDDRLVGLLEDGRGFWRCFDREVRAMMAAMTAAAVMLSIRCFMRPPYLRLRR